MIDLLLAAASGGTTGLEWLGYVGVPVTIFLAGVIFGIFKGAMRFAQYLARSEQAQATTAQTNTEIRDQLTTFMEKTDSHLAQHDQDIAVLKYAQSHNGTKP